MMWKTITEWMQVPKRVTLLFALLALCMILSGRATPVNVGQVGHGVRPASRPVRIAVLGLFHPRRLKVSVSSGQALVLRAGDQNVILEESSGSESAEISVSGDRVVARVGTRVLNAPAISFSGRREEPVDFVLAIPGKITRPYSGTLEIRPSTGSLIAVVTLDQEAAVASVVAAESAPDTPMEALKAQAVAARSYFASGRGRHRDFDFCDTTHCQFMRNPPAPDSAVFKAVEATLGLVLAYDSHPFPAMYTRSCSGRTHTPAQLGITPANYPYYSVSCEYCRSHPVRWTTKIPATDAGFLRSSDEGSRLRVDRRLGWSAVPSDDFVATKDGDQVLLNGIGNGHGIGLCQFGAKAMAEHGASFREILSHYYPNTDIVSWPTKIS